MKTMSKLKKKTSHSKISKDVVSNYDCWNSEKFVLLSFAFVTGNKDYNFNYFESSRAREELSARIALDELLEELSKNTWQELTQRSKYQKGGFEKIPYSSCKESIFNKFKITPDTSIYSFRFGKGDAYRLLGIKPTSCHKLNILGYDFDYSAYDHGS